MDSPAMKGPKVTCRILEKDEEVEPSVKLNGIQLDVSLPSNCAQSAHGDDDGLSTSPVKMSVEQKLAMRQALQNPLLLRTIFGSLDQVADLKSCRLVASNWSTVSSEILTKNDVCKISIYYYEPIPPLTAKQGKGWIFGNATRAKKSTTFRTGQSLSDLTNLMKNYNTLQNSSFCCSHFHFKNGNLGEEAAQQFFKLHGPKIRTLCLESIDEDIDYSDDDSEHGDMKGRPTDKTYQTWTSRSTFMDILNKKCPCLEILNLKNLWNHWSESDSSSDSDSSDSDLDHHRTEPINGGNNSAHKMCPLSLPTLKLFKWTGVLKQVVKQVLEGSPNLQKIGRQVSPITEAELSMIVKTKSASKLKNLRFLSPWNPSYLNKLINGHSGRVELQKLSLWRPNVDDPMDIKLALRLMNCTKTSLEFLDVSLYELVSNNNLDFAQEYNWEIWQQLKFEKVTTLKLQTAQCCLPLRRVRSLPEMFPNLKILDLTTVSPADVIEYGYGDDGESVIWPELRSSSFMVEALTHVSTLRIPDSCVDVPWLLLLHQLCPKFEHLVVQGKKNLHEVLPQIFKNWTHLKSLKLIFKKSDPFYSYSYPAKLDSAFTGLSKDICQKLLNIPGHDQYVESECQYSVDNHRIVDDDDRMTGPSNSSTLQEFKMTVSVSVKIKKPKAEGPSIVDLKKLEVLEIVFERLKVFAVDGLPLSCLSWMYGFNLIPNLKVVLQFDHNACSAEELRTVYKNLAPYCPNLRHKTFSYNY